MKKLNTKGFTLIELLAVITIMGVLMLVAIPAVSRTIENSRRDAFANTAKEYVNAVRNAVLADSIKCTVGGTTMVASAVPDGNYYFRIDSTSQGTKDLMESGGKSSFGSAEVKGYIMWKKETTGSGNKIEYKIMMIDSGNHGIDSYVTENDISRSKVSMATSNKYTSGGLANTAPSGSSRCELA